MNDFTKIASRKVTSGGPRAERSVGSQPPVKPAEGVTLGLVLAQHQLVAGAHLRLDDPVTVPDKD